VRLLAWEDESVSSPSAPEQRVVAGRYRLRRLLGQGSMGTVWEAYDEYLQRPVAVKEVRQPPGMPRAEADELRERTLREARAIAVVSHPNVITLHDVAREGEDPFVVMEYMPARNLSELLRAFGPLEVPHAATVGYAVAAGLAAAHEAGITHRDVKPGNVLVAQDGRVKLTDFGISRNVAEMTMTSTGIMLGSPAYIAPEVASGKEVTPAADLWGLGATLFAAVEGRPPYDPDGPVLETLSAVVNGEVPTPSHAGPLTEVIAALMVKDPAGRASLADVRKMLHPLLPPPGTPIYTANLEDVPTRGVIAPVPVTARSAPEPETPAATPAVPALAADPGPLPFLMPGPGAPARRPRRPGRLRATLVTLTAVVLFVAAAGGGFALARVLSGRPVLPPAQTAAPAPPSSPKLDELALVPTPGDASTLAGEQGGGYSVPVPRGWSKFVEQRATPGLPNSSRLHYLSPDGTQDLTVERFPSFYPKLSINAYVGLVRKQVPDVAHSQLDTPPNGPEPALELTYKTTDVARNVGSGEARRGADRITFAHVLPVGADLWVVSMTVPIDLEDSGHTLFNKIAPGFSVTG
jgi:tRNA A-37 threonylcarbamoyl transferase component Bud32